MSRTLKRLGIALALTLALCWPAFAAAKTESNCVTCHKTVTPNIVKDFLAGEMGKSGSVDCSDCHGKGHQSATDVAKVSCRPRRPARNATPSSTTSTPTASTPRPGWR